MAIKLFPINIIIN